MSPLEHEVMGVVWDRGQAAAEDVGGSVERLLVGLVDGDMLDRKQLSELQARVQQAAAREAAPADRKRRSR